MRSRLRRRAARDLLAVLLAAFAGLAFAQPKSDWERAEEERNWSEGSYSLPAYPKGEDLVPFDAAAGGSFRFFIDLKSLSVGADGIVRYTVVARSPSGVENVSFEGIRCRSASVRAYAFGQGDGRWSVRGTDWRQIDPRGAQRWRHALWREYFCPHTIAIRDAAEGIDALRQGGHPAAPRADTFGR